MFALAPTSNIFMPLCSRDWMRWARLVLVPGSGTNPFAEVCFRMACDLGISVALRKPASRYVIQLDECLDDLH